MFVKEKKTKTEKKACLFLQQSTVTKLSLVLLAMGQWGQIGIIYHLSCIFLFYSFLDVFVDLKTLIDCNGVISTYVLSVCFNLKIP